ncbi:MAG: methyl-accepting chemotaxis protein [Nitrospirae bacterium]|nr:methyl-accepting chemotaxis protein [Nitrospirota bacterium]
MFKFKKIGIKIIIIVAVAIFLMMSAIATRVVISEKKAFTADLTNKGESLAKFMAKVAPASILTYDVSMLDSYVKELTKDREVLYSVILNKNGDFLSAHLDKEKKLIAGLKDKKDDDMKNLIKEIGAKKNVIEIEQPIIYQNETIGTVRIGLTKQILNQKIREQILAIIIVSLVGIILAIAAIAIYVTKGVATPLNRDVSFARAVASGDMTQRLGIKTDDELGTLGEALNKMVDDLKGIIVKIKTSSTNATATSNQLADTSKKLFNGANIQMESVEATSASINQMNSSTKGVADAAEDLSRSANESSSAILEMTTSINQIADSTSTLSSLVETSSSSIEEMSASMKEIAENVIVLSTAAEETASAVNEITTTIKAIEANADTSAALSENVKRDASELGMKAIEKTMAGMERIMKSVEATGQTINRLGERSQQIEKILTVIDEVTDQTTLLALNAAILAAQAGEHGKGFAVVADEIKDLAERTAASTKEIAQMIASIQNEVGESVTAIKEGSKSAIEGMQLSKEAKDALNKILEGADKSAQMTLEIKRTTQEQTKGASQVNELVQTTTQMVKDIARSTQEQRKGSEQIMEAVERMRDVARQVQQSIIEQTKGVQLRTSTIKFNRSPGPPGNNRQAVNR